MSAPLSLLVPSYPNVDRGDAVTAIYWVEAIIAFLFVLVRLYARRTIRGIGLDDYFMFLTSVGHPIVKGDR